jgi:broad specificity phosphatase PhoE
MPVTRRCSALAVVMFFGAVTLASTDAEAQRLVLLVRHAERADGGAPPATSMTAPADPDLSPEGRARAERLAVMLADAGVTEIVVTEFRRTQQTAAPLAAKLGLTPKTATAADVSGLAARLTASSRDELVLVVGHTSSVPALITALGGPKTTIAEADYGSLFVFAPATKALTRLRY